MPFLEKTDLKNSIYAHQIDQITEDDDAIVLQAINTAIVEVQSYLDNTKYDSKVIFEKTGADRNALILTHTITITKWYIIDLCNAEIIYEVAKERYDRATAWLKKLATGGLALSGLPLKSTDDSDTAVSENYKNSYGSRPKFNHE